MSEHYSAAYYAFLAQQSRLRGADLVALADARTALDDRRVALTLAEGIDPARIDRNGYVPSAA